MVEISLSKKYAIDSEINTQMKDFKELLNGGSFDDISSFFTKLNEEYIKNVDYNYISYVYGKLTSKLTDMMDDYIVGKDGPDDIYNFVIDAVANMKNYQSVTTTSYEEFIEEFKHLQNIYIDMENDMLMNNVDVFINLRNGINGINQSVKTIIKLKLPTHTKESPQKEETFKMLKDLMIKTYNEYLGEVIEEVNKIFETHDETEAEQKLVNFNQTNIYFKQSSLNKVLWSNELDLENFNKLSEKVKLAIEEASKEKKDLKKSFSYLYNKVRSNDILISKIYEFVFRFNEYKKQEFNKDGEMKSEGLIYLFDSFENLRSRCAKLKNDFKAKIVKRRVYTVTRNENHISIIDIRYVYEEMYNLFDFYRKIEKLYEENEVIFKAYTSVFGRNFSGLNINIYINEILTYFFFPYIIKDYFPNTLVQAYEKRENKCEKEFNSNVDKLGFTNYDLTDLPIIMNNKKDIHKYFDVYTLLLEELIIRSPSNLESHLYFYDTIYNFMHENYQGDTDLEVFQDNPGDRITLGFNKEEDKDNSIFNYFQKIDNEYSKFLVYGKNKESIITPVRKWKRLENKFTYTYKGTDVLFKKHDVDKQPFDYKFSTRLLTNKDYGKFFESDKVTDTTASKFIKQMKKSNENDILPGSLMSENNKRSINAFLKYKFIMNKKDDMEFKENIKDLRTFIVNTLDKFYKMPESEEKVRSYFKFYSDEEFQKMLDKDPNHFKHIIKRTVIENKDNMDRMVQYFKERKDADLYSIMHESKMLGQTEDHYVYYKIRSNNININKSDEEEYQTLVSLDDICKLVDQTDDTIYYYIDRYVNQINDTFKNTRYFDIEWDKRYKKKMSNVVRSLVESKKAEKEKIQKGVRSDFYLNKLVIYLLNRKKYYVILRKVLKYINHMGMFKYMNSDYRDLIRVPVSYGLEDTVWNINYDKLPTSDNDIGTYIKLVKNIMKLREYNEVKNVNINQIKIKNNIKRVVELLNNSIENESIEELKKSVIKFDKVNLFKFYEIDLENSYKEEYTEKLKIIISLLEKRRNVFEKEKIVSSGYDYDYDHNIKVLKQMIADKDINSKVEVKGVEVNGVMTESVMTGVTKEIYGELSIQHLFNLYGIDSSKDYQSSWKKSLENIISYLMNTNDKYKIMSTKDDKNIDANLEVIYESINKSVTVGDIIKHFTTIGNNLTRTNDNKVNINMIVVIAHKILYSLHSNKDNTNLGNVIYDLQYIANDYKSMDQYAAILFLSTLRKLSVTDLDEEHLIQKLNMNGKILDKISDFLKNNDLFSYKKEQIVGKKMTKEQKKEEKVEEKRNKLKTESVGNLVSLFRDRNNKKKDVLQDKLNNFSEMIKVRKSKKEDISNLIKTVRKTRRELELLKRRNNVLFEYFKIETNLSKVYISKKHFIEKSYRLCEHNEAKRELSVLSSRLTNVKFSLNTAREKIKGDPTNSSLKKEIDKNQEKIENLKGKIKSQTLRFDSFLTGAEGRDGQNTICNRCGQVLITTIVSDYGKGSFQEQQEVNEINRYIRESGLLPILNKEKEIQKLVLNVNRMVINFKNNIKLEEKGNPDFDVENIDFSPLYENEENDNNSIMYKYFDNNYKSIYAMASNYVRECFKFANSKKMSVNKRNKIKELINIYFSIASYVHIIYFILGKGIYIVLEGEKLTKKIKYKHIKEIYQTLSKPNDDKRFFDGFDIDKTFNNSKQINFYINIYNMVIKHDVNFKEVIRFVSEAPIQNYIKKSDKIIYDKEVDFHIKIRGNYLNPSTKSKKKKFTEEVTIKKNEIVNDYYVRFMFNLRDKLNILDESYLNYYRIEKGDIDSRLLETKDEPLKKELKLKKKYFQNILNQGKNKDCDIDILESVFLLIKKDFLLSKEKTEYEKKINDIDRKIKETMYCNKWTKDTIDLSTFQKYSNKDIYNNFLLLYLHINYSKSYNKINSKRIKKNDPDLSKELNNNYNEWYENYIDIMDEFNKHVKQDGDLEKEGIMNGDDLLDDYNMLNLYLLKLFNQYNTHINYLVNAIKDIKELVENRIFSDYYENKSITEEEDTNVEEVNVGVDGVGKLNLQYREINILINGFMSKYTRVNATPTKIYIRKLVISGFDNGIESLLQFYKENSHKMDNLLKIKDNMDSFEKILKNRIDHYNRFTNELIRSNILYTVKRQNIYLDMIRDNLKISDKLKSDKRETKRAANNENGLAAEKSFQTADDDYSGSDLYIYSAILNIPKKDIEARLQDKYLPKNQKVLTKLNFLGVSEQKYLHLLVPYLHTATDSNEEDKMKGVFININNYVQYQFKKDKPIYIPSRESDDIDDLNRLYGKSYSNYLLNLYLMKESDGENRLSKILREKLSDFMLELDKGGRFKGKLNELGEKTKDYDDTMIRLFKTIESMKTNIKFNLIKRNVNYQEMIINSKRVVGVVDIYKDKYTSMKKEYQDMLFRYKHEDLLEFRKILTKIKLPIIDIRSKQIDMTIDNKYKFKGEIIYGNTEESKQIDMSIDKRTIKRFIVYGEGDRLYEGEDVGSEYSESKNEEFMKNIFKYFDVMKSNLIRREIPLSDEDASEKSKTWVHVPHYNKWNKLRFEKDYIPYCVLKSLIRKLNAYCSSNYIKNHDDHNIKGIYDSIEQEFDEKDINTDVIYNYYYERNVKFLQNVFPLRNHMKIIYSQRKDTEDEVKEIIKKELQTHKIVKYENNVIDRIVYGYKSDLTTRNYEIKGIFNKSELTEEIYKLEKTYSIMLKRGDSDKELDQVQEMVERKKFDLEQSGEKHMPLWKRDNMALIQLHQDYVIDKLKEFGIEKPFEGLKKLITNPEYIYEGFSDLLQKYVDNYFSIIDKQNIVIDRMSSYNNPNNRPILKKINKTFAIEEFIIYKYQLKQNNGIITEDEADELRDLINSKLENIKKENRKKKYKYKLLNDSNGQPVKMSSDEEQSVLLKKLRTQFLLGKVMMNTFKEINNIILNNLLKDSFKEKDESVEDMFNSVFKSDESNINLDENLMKQYDVAKVNLFKMYDDYKNFDKNMVDKFINMYNHYPEESEAEITNYIKKLDSKKEKKEGEKEDEEIETPSFCSYIPIRRGPNKTRSASEYLKISVEDKTDIEIVSMYKERYPHHKVQMHGDHILICPITTIKETKQQINDLSNFLDPIIESLKTLSNGSYNAFLYNNDKVSKIENMMLGRIPRLGLTKEATKSNVEENLNNFVLSFDKKSIKKFIDSSTKPISTFDSTGESNLNPQLDSGRIGTLLNMLLEGENIDYSGGKFNEITLTDLYELLEKLETMMADGDDSVSKSIIKSVKKKISKIEKMQNMEIDKIDDKLEYIEDLNTKSNPNQEDEHDEFDIGQDAELEQDDESSDNEVEQDGYDGYDTDDEDDDEDDNDEKIKKLMKK